MLREQGKLDEAVAGYRRALAITPQFTEMPNNLAMGLKQQGNLDESIALNRPALELTPGLAELIATSASPCMSRGSWTRRSLVIAAAWRGTEPGGGVLQFGRRVRPSGEVSGIGCLTAAGSGD